VRCVGKVFLLLRRGDVCVSRKWSPLIGWKLQLFRCGERVADAPSETQVAYPFLGMAFFPF
jgi:hypothetical protein